MYVDVDFELDASGLNCPLPLLKAKKALAALNSGQLLRITATDPGSQRDFEAFAQHAQHKLVESREETGTFIYILEKG